MSPVSVNIVSSLSSNPVTLPTSLAPLEKTSTLKRHQNRLLRLAYEKPFPSSPWPLFQIEGRWSAFDMEISFHSHANKTHFHKKGCAPSLILKVRVFGTRKPWLITTLVLTAAKFVVCFFFFFFTITIMNLDMTDK